MTGTYKINGRPVSLAVTQQGDGLVVAVDGEEIAIEGFDIADGHLTFRTGGRTERAVYAALHGHLHVAVGGRCFEFSPEEDADDADGGIGHFSPEVSSPMPGKVLDVLVSVGDTVEAGTPVVLMEAMKMETTVKATADARVVEVRVEAGAMVTPGQVLLVLEKLDA